MKSDLYSPTLSPRLRAALAMLGSASCIADIGCDHGKLSLAMLQSGAAEQVIASDISEPSLLKAQQLAKAAGMSDRVICRCSDGFSAYSVGEIEKAVILGMGGELIASILDKHIDLVRGLDLIVMQPMRGEAELRGYLYNNGFCIKDECVVYDNGRYYQLISAFAGTPAPLPKSWPKDYWQFGAIAVEKHDANLLKLMYRYLSIIVQKLKKAEGKGSAPIALLREMDCTRRIIRLYCNTAQIAENEKYLQGENDEL